MLTQKNAKGPEISSIDVNSYSTRFMKFITDELFNDEYNHHPELERKHKNKINCTHVQRRVLVVLEAARWYRLSG